MGVAEAIVIGSLATAGASVYSAQQSKKATKKAEKVPDINQDDKKELTRDDLTGTRNTSARKAAIAGTNPTGILSNSNTSGRGTLLGN